VKHNKQHYNEKSVLVVINVITVYVHASTPKRPLLLIYMTHMTVLLLTSHDTEHLNKKLLVLKHMEI
jgi:hypothetical protein